MRVSVLCFALLALAASAHAQEWCKFNCMVNDGTNTTITIAATLCVPELVPKAIEKCPLVLSARGQAYKSCTSCSLKPKNFTSVALTTDSCTPLMRSAACCQAPGQEIIKCCTAKAACVKNLVQPRDCPPAVQQVTCCRTQSQPCCNMATPCPTKMKMGTLKPGPCPDCKKADWK